MVTTDSGVDKRSRSQRIPWSDDDTISVQRSTVKRLFIRAELQADVADGHCVASLRPRTTSRVTAASPQGYLKAKGIFERLS